MKILLVEDDSLARSALSTILTSHDYTVNVAIDGLTGLEIASTQNYDLIILDIIIPKLDGISLCRRLRAEGCHAPILLLTAKDSSSDRVMGLDAGADDYIVKPYDPEELLARIRALLRRQHKQEPDETIVWDGIRLDRGSSHATYNNHLLHLTPKEYCLLELFLSNPKRVFSRRAILDRLWDFAKSPGEETVSTHVKCLRQKLKAAGAADPIETVHGLGYRLKASSHPQAGTTQSAVSASSELPAEPAVSEKALTITATVWDRFKENYLEKIELLVQSASALFPEQHSPETQSAMQQAAHKLAGGLGIFGFTTGSRLAKELERLLERPNPLTPEQVRQIVAKIAQLQQAIASCQPLDFETKETRYAPMLLIIDDDLALAERVRVEVLAARVQVQDGWNLRIEIATDLQVARHMIAQVSPDVILLDLNFPGAAEGGLTLLQELAERRPKIPVVVFTGRETLSDRLAVAQLGGHAFLHKPMPPHQILNAVFDALHQRNHPKNRILVVDDDAAVLAQLFQWFKPLGVDVITLDDAAQFWHILTSTQPDLLVLDVEMSQFSGVELCQVVRNAPQWRSLPIVFLSGHADEHSIAQAFAAGADDYLYKSMPEADLVHRILRRLSPGNGQETLSPSHSAYVPLSSKPIV